MITPNSKVTALEILQECGVENAEAIFGTARVRIGGISGINTATHLINIPASAKTLEVIVVNKIYDLELAEGTPEDNAEVRTISTEAKKAVEEKGKKATKEAEKLQEVKQIVTILRAGGEFVPKNKKEEKLLEQATEINESHKVAVELAKQAKAERPRTTVKSE